MISDPGHVPSASPWSITLTYRHEHLWWFGADDAPGSWHVSADIYDDSGTHVESRVGDINIVLIDIDDTRDPFGLLDGGDADLGLIGETIFGGSGGLDPDLDRRLELLGSRILILNSVLAAEWRNFREAVAALDRVWAKLGFEHFGDGIHVLDLNLTTLDENLAQLRKDAERYHALQG